MVVAARNTKERKVDDIPNQGSRWFGQWTEHYLVDEGKTLILLLLFERICRISGV